MTESEKPPEKIPVIGGTQIKLPEIRIPGSEHGRIPDHEIPENERIFPPSKVKRLLDWLVKPVRRAMAA